jgi:hypothetical protein
LPRIEEPHVPWQDGLASRVHGVHRSFSSGSPSLG